MNTRSLWILLILMMSILVSGCQPSAPADPTVTTTAIPSVTSTATATLTAAPTATMTIVPTVTMGPTKPAIDPASNFPTGKFVQPENEANNYFIFNEDGRWSHYFFGERTASGTFAVEGDTYIQLTSSGAAGANCPVPMSFTYSFDGTSLTFQLTDQSQNDPCVTRKGLHDNTTYKLSE